MILLDAYAIIAVLVDEPASDEVAALLAQGDCGVCTVNLAEAADVLARTRGLPISRTRDAVESLSAGALTILDLDSRRAWRAADVHARHYRRRASEISLADCVLIASAAPGRDTIATPDPPVIAAARADGVSALPLRDSTGGRPR